MADKYEPPKIRRMGYNDRELLVKFMLKVEPLLLPYLQQMGGHPEVRKDRIWRGRK